MHPSALRQNPPTPHFLAHRSGCVQSSHTGTPNIYDPARSLAPALFAGEPLQYLWIYVVGPVGGALLAGLAGRLIRHFQPFSILTIAGR